MVITIKNSRKHKRLYCVISQTIYLITFTCGHVHDTCKCQMKKPVTGNNTVKLAPYLVLQNLPQMILTFIRFWSIRFRFVGRVKLYSKKSSSPLYQALSLHTFQTIYTNVTNRVEPVFWVNVNSFVLCLCIVPKHINIREHQTQFEKKHHTCFDLFCTCYIK